MDANSLKSVGEVAPTGAALLTHLTAFLAGVGIALVGILFRHMLEKTRDRTRRKEKREDEQRDLEYIEINESFDGAYERMSKTFHKLRDCNPSQWHSAFGSLGDSTGSRPAVDEWIRELRAWVEREYEWAVTQLESDSFYGRRRARLEEIRDKTMPIFTFLQSAVFAGKQRKWREIRKELLEH